MYQHRNIDSAWKHTFNPARLIVCAGNVVKEKTYAPTVAQLMITFQYN